MRIGWHGLGVLAMAVSLTDSYGPEDGQSVAPQIEKKAMVLHIKAVFISRMRTVTA